MDNQILKTIADNPPLTEALKKLFKNKFEIDEINTDMSNELIGQITRARLDGLEKIEEVFKEIDGYKTVPDKPLKKMEGR